MRIEASPRRRFGSGATTPTSTGFAQPTAAVWLRVSASLVLDELGEPALIRGVSLDVTALKEAEAERESSYSLLQATLDATADAILVVNLEGQITAYNRPFVELWPIPQAVLDTGDDAAPSAAWSTASPTRTSSSAG